MFLLLYSKGWVSLRDLQKLLIELKDMSFFKKGELCIVGCSTSEVIGERIGSVGSLEIAKEIFDALKQIEEDTGVSFVFQGCEHINRAITIERADFNPLSMEEVNVVQMYMQVVVYQRMPTNIWIIQWL